MIERLRKDDEAQIAGVRVLVLDDETTVRRLVQRALEARGCDVISAGHGREGLQLLLDQDVDVLVVDVVMDGMDGPTFLREARKIWPWLGVVVITGFASSTVVDEIRALGVDRLLTKPLDIDALHQSVLGEAVAKRRRIGQPACHSLERVKYQLGILRRLSETAIASGSLVEALRELSLELGRLLPCEVVGLLVMQEEDPTLMLAMQRAVGPEFLSEISAEVRHQHEALTGVRLEPGRVRVRLEGAGAHPEGPPSVGSTFTVPVMGEGELQGLLILGAVSDEAYSAEDISFLYHAANHLSAIFLALNRMRELAILDSLTGLFNRRRLEEELDLAWQRGLRYGHVLSICMIDVDHFKTINDTQGHLAGDEVLEELAEVIREAARASDVIGRYGGDEVLVLLPDGGRVAGRAFAERLLAAVRGRPFRGLAPNRHITVSIGVSAAEPGLRGQTVHDVLNQADQALYEAKRAGRNQVSVWDRKPPEPPAASGDDRRLDLARQRPGARILVVDDEPDIADSLRRILHLHGFTVDTCGAAQEAVERLETASGCYDVLVTDLQMPGRSGLDLLKDLNDADQELVKVVITGNATVHNAVESLRHGAYDFIEKPIRPEPLVRILERAVEYRRLMSENRNYRMYLEDMVRERSAALAQALEELKASYDFTLEAMVALLDAREHATAQHTARVRAVAELLAQAMGLPERDITTIGRGALLHDIGKIAIPDHILLKPAALTEPEQAIMKTHPEVGYRVLESSQTLQDAAEIVRCHHERFDGTGYPRRLKGNEICLGARIFAIADAYDAMRSDRPYRRAMRIEASIAEIEKGCGSQFDPDVVRLFLDHIDAVEGIGGWGSGD